MERLADSGQDAIRTCQDHLQTFAENGYRTLCFSTRTISERDYNEWNKVYYNASIALEDREKLLADAAEQVEKELTLIGATAIEDKLQDVNFNTKLLIIKILFSLCPRQFKRWWLLTFEFGF